MTTIPTDSSDAREQAEREPLHGPDLARATLAAIRAQHGLSTQAAAEASNATNPARMTERGGPIWPSVPVSAQVSDVAADTESAGSLEAKAVALLAAGRVSVLDAGSGRLIADVVGETATYRVTLGRGGWACMCVAARHHYRCSHVTAVRLIVAKRSSPQSTAESGMA